VRQYFDKIKDAEDPAKRQLAIDKVVASRFIKHAIAQAKDTRPITVSSSTTHIRANDNDNNGGGSSAATAHDVRVPVKVTEKMLEREKYHEALREEAPASDVGGDLEVFDGEDEPSDEAGRTPPEEDASSYSPLQASSSELGATGKQKGKGKAKAKAVVGGTPIHDVPPASETAAGKRRRPPVDPFAGYGDGQDTAAPADAGFTTNASRSGTKVRRIHKEGLGAEASSGTNTPSGGEHQDQVKRSKKRSKKKSCLVNSVSFPRFVYQRCNMLLVSLRGNSKHYIYTTTKPTPFELIKYNFVGWGFRKR